MPTNAAQTVLIVDDDPDIRDSIEELLRSDGLPPATAANGEEALRALETGPVGVILLDLMMPVMDGRQFVEELRRRRIDIPVILLSAGRDLRRVAAELDLPAIEKPFDLDDLLGKVRSELERQGPVGQRPG
jgi:DNA-binding response OmpR family regulator